MIKEIRESLEEYIELNKNNILKEQSNVIYLSFKDLIETDVTLAEVFIENHDEFIKTFEYVMNDKFNFEKEKKVRFIDVYDSYHIDIWKLRANQINAFVKIKGQISVISTISPKVTDIKYSCGECGNVINVLQTGNFISIPKRCSCGKKKGFTEEIRIYQDYMKIIIEEEQTKVPIGQQPSRIIVELYDDLTKLELFKNLRVNKTIVINGVIKAKEKGKAMAVEQSLYMYAHSIELEDENTDLMYSAKEIKTFKQMAKDKQVKHNLIQSFVPEVVGMNDIKEALMLQILGGNNIYDTKNNLLERGTFSICIVGCVGTGKTKLARLSLRYAPIGARMASGKGSSGKGLVAVVVNDKELGEFVLKAGAVALAHNSVCFIDEIDKIEKDDQHNLNNTMSDLQTPIDKGGINTVIQTNTAIIGVANPIHKRFIPEEEIENQITIPEDIKDRFDLIFIIKDDVEEEKDRRIIGIVLDTCNQETKLTPYTQEIVKGYLNYMKQLQPKLSKEAKMFIENEYVSLRQIGKKTGSTRFSARLGESIIRLATATAKLYGRKSVNLDDVESAKRILIESMRKRGLYKDGQGFSIEKMEGITSQTMRDRYKAVKEVVITFAKKYDFVYESAILDKCLEEHNIENDEVFEQLDKLKKSGIIFEPKRRQYQLLK